MSSALPYINQWHSDSMPIQADGADLLIEPRPHPRLHRSALAAPPSSDQACDGKQLIGYGNMRRSELLSGSATAKQITTMENADLDVLLGAMGAVIRAYVKDSAHHRRSVLQPSAAFDEDMHPLDVSGIWRCAPTANVVEAFVRAIVVALELDELSLVIALVLLERAMGKDHKGLVICERTWRPALLMSIIVASKVVYDEKVFLADYREQLPELCLDGISAQELAFLTLINFNTSVRRGQYAKYYYALEDVGRSNRRRCIK